MPIYEYRCDCGGERDEILPLADSDKVQVCECGKIMERKISVCSFVIVHNGSERALDFLNSSDGEFPHAHTPQHRREFQQEVFAGTQEPPRTQW